MWDNMLTLCSISSAPISVVIRCRPLSALSFIFDLQFSENQWSIMSTLFVCQLGNFTPSVRKCLLSSFCIIYLFLVKLFVSLLLRFWACYITWTLALCLMYIMWIFSPLNKLYFYFGPHFFHSEETFELTITPCYFCFCFLCQWGHFIADSSEVSTV